MTKRYIYLALLSLTVLSVLFFVKWVKSDGALSSCFIETYKDPDKKLLALEAELIKKGFLKDNSLGSYRNLHINFWSYQYSIEQRMEMSQVLTSHIDDSSMAACIKSGFKALLLNSGNLYKVMESLSRFEEMAREGTANADVIEESNEYVKTPDSYLQKRIKPEWFESGATKLGIYHLLDTQLREYNGGDILFEHFVKRYKEEGDAMFNQVDQEASENLKKETLDKAMSNDLIERVIIENSGVLDEVETEIDVPYEIEVKRLRLLKHKVEAEKLRLLEQKSKSR